MLNDARITETITSTAIDLLGDLHDEDESIPLDATFADVGLNSLMLARLVITLEGELGLDPFTDERTIVDVHTFRELVTTYVEAAARQNQLSAEATR